MAPSLLDTFRSLASFDPPRRSLAGAPWEEYADWAIAQGLAPMAAYNLEYRMAGAGAPEWVRDRLLSVYQGSLNDNVMKLVNFKRAADEVEGQRWALLGGASFAEALYPHVAFRPVLEIQLLAAPESLAPLFKALGQADFRPDPAAAQEAGAAHALSDGRTAVIIRTRLLGPGREAAEAAMARRLLPMKVYGPSAFRLDLEDAVLALCLEHAREGYQVPLISFVDLRELLLGAPSLGGPYSRKPDFATLKTRAKEWRLERALWASASVAARLFPELEATAAEARPGDLRGATRQLLERLVVGPVCALGKLRVVRGADRLRRWLVGGAG
ncbi:MAG TPA: nucleotidyltransferase family protein [Myxococcaceae bacterium]|nr:nucleotidyltransferase family protein [Myxococcaceae bacterium]